jgi:prepilin-type processing-associated H-X9-DG protein
MKIQRATNRIKGMTLIEVLVVITVFFVLVAMILPALSKAKTGRHINCINNIKQIGLSFLIWAGDNDNKYPMQASPTNGGVMGLIGNRNAYLLWQSMSNELSTPRVLLCPDDHEHIQTTDFTTNFSDANISYFFNLDADESNPKMILIGDDNLAVNGVRVPPGILNLSTNSSVAWTKERHNGTGNICLTDGSVQQDTTSGLVLAISNAAAPSRLVIP